MEGSLLARLPWYKTTVAIYAGNNMAGILTDSLQSPKAINPQKTQNFPVTTNVGS